MNRQEYNKMAPHPLQSWEWGEFREKWGNEIVRTSYGQLTIHKLPLVPYKLGMFIKGPVPTKKILGDLKELSKKEKLIFIKLEPNITKDRRSITVLKKNGAIPGKTLFTPTSFWIDLTKNEDDLMKSFQSKTRYNIRLAQRRGVEVREDNSDKTFEKYIKLTKETVERQGFYAHTEKYHRLMWKTLHKDMVQKDKKPIARLLTAHYQGEVVTAWIVFVWKDFLYYPYGASANKHKNVMANNLVMWEAIKYGKKLGLKTFDLWGREPGKGFTRFKEGYNPKVVEFLGTWDLVTSPFYYLYRAAEALRWIFLRFRAKFSFSRAKF